MKARGAKITKSCLSCGQQFIARLADNNRGWARYCGKTCKAKHQAASLRDQKAKALNEHHQG